MTSRIRLLSTILGASMAALILHPHAASAEPFQLRADALAQTKSPTGLLVLSGEDKVRRWLDADGVVWLGDGRARYDAGNVTGDVMTLTVRLHDPSGRGELKAGRFVAGSGVVRPLHLDGVSAIGRTPFGTIAEVFGGLPVVPRFGARPYDWAGGGRVGQSVGNVVSFGVSYVHQRLHGRAAAEEVGADVASIPVKWLDLTGRASWDLLNPGIAAALASVAVREGDWRVEGFAINRSPSRMLPATSLFAALGDLPSTRIGASVRWKAAPRLELLGSGAAQAVGGDTGLEAFGRGTLALDEDQRGSLGLEARRMDVGPAQWTGLRGIVRVPISRALRASSELEIVAPDNPDGRGDLWPWALAALTWTRRGWEVSGAVEASAGRTFRYDVNGLLRASYSWDAK